MLCTIEMNNIKHIIRIANNKTLYNQWYYAVRSKQSIIHPSIFKILAREAKDAIIIDKVTFWRKVTSLNTNTCFCQNYNQIVHDQINRDDSFMINRIERKNAFEKYFVAFYLHIHLLLLFNKTIVSSTWYL